MTTTTATTNKLNDYNANVADGAVIVWYPFGFVIDKLRFINRKADKTGFAVHSGKLIFYVSVYDDSINVYLCKDCSGSKADKFIANNFPLRRFIKRLVAGRIYYGLSIGDIKRIRLLVSGYLYNLGNV